MPTYPAAHLLVSADAPTAPADLAVVRAPLANGLPAFVDLSNALRLKVTLPTGLMAPWLHADPSALVSTSDDGLHPWSSTPNGTVPAIRLSVIRGATTLATSPVTLDAQRRLPASGDPTQGIAVEMVVLSWAVFAGTVQGAGDFGSFIQFGWSIADRAVSAFGPPVINPHLQRRLLPHLRLQSQLGLTKLVLDNRFAVRRWALHVDA